METIVVDKITKEYGSRVVLNAINFSVKEGSIHGFLGPNGAGKSTTMKIMAGLLSATDGEIYIKGKKVSQDPNYVKSIVGILPEDLPLYPYMRVEEFLRFVAQINGVMGKDIQKRVDYTLEKTRLKDVSQRVIGNLSRGYKQRVGVAQALVFNPEVIILDEPTLGLDPASIKEMREFIKELKQGHTIILSSHQLHEVGQICDELTIINEGEIVTTGSFSEIVSRFKTSNMVEVEMENFQAEKMKSLTGKLKFIESFEYVEVENKIHFFLNTEVKSISELCDSLVQDGFKITSFNQKKSNLEDVFLEATSR